MLSSEGSVKEPWQNPGGVWIVWVVWGCVGSMGGMGSMGSMVCVGPVWVGCFPMSNDGAWDSGDSQHAQIQLLLLEVPGLSCQEVTCGSSWER